MLKLKKIASVLLTAALLATTACFATVSASADETATYYFLAPDDFFATNDQVGFYYWAPAENAAWPGQAMTPAPEVGENVFKCEAPSMDATSTIIFNAFVDAGNPADPALAAVAHQTVNINTEGYAEGESEVYDALGMELDDFNGMIYVLNRHDRTINDYSGAATTVGEWFSIDPSAPNYYKNFDKYYGSYDDEIVIETGDVPSQPSTDSDTTSSNTSVSSDSDSDLVVVPDTDNSSKNDTSSNTSSKKSTPDNASKTTSSKSTTTSSASTSTVQTAGTVAVVALVVILMTAAAAVIYTKKKANE